jgi:hypothetical protein
LLDRTFVSMVNLDLFHPGFSFLPLSWLQQSSSFSQCSLYCGLYTVAVGTCSVSDSCSYTAEEYSFRSVPMSCVHGCGFGVDIGDSSYYQSYMHEVFVSLPQVFFPNLFSVITYFFNLFFVGH